ncbi:hypothetical protein F4777DRAFT_538450 [Nemania sp. FL0916]|nr:hypothetical protein F4777DRAFT_538450 [Nemania sp. FL0916]
MHFYKTRLAYLQAVLISLFLHGGITSALSWRGRGNTQPAAHHRSVLEPGNSPSQSFQIGAREPTSFDIAFNEMKALESEPLCHQIAARLLVHNCQLIEGKDEATVYTDSGHQIMDFVDSYAASLAICDLERGRFTIPTQCRKLRQSYLSQLPIPNHPRLHLTSEEIRGCLSGLGASSSAWNTWLSYRPRALGFCEAAKVENEKAQTIALFQRLIKIMSRFSDDVGDEVGQQLKDIILRFKAADEHVGGLVEKLQSMDSVVSHEIFQAIMKSQVQADSAVGKIAHLERVIEVLIKTATDGLAEAAAVHDQSVQLMSQQTRSEIDIVKSGMVESMEVVTAIQNQAEKAHSRMVDMQSVQDKLLQGTEQLEGKVDMLDSRMSAHADSLQQAENTTAKIHENLGRLATEFSGSGSFASLWPHIWCPLASLVLGSYGLPASLLRNVVLVVLGEATGFIISSPPSLPQIVGVFRSFIHPLQSTVIIQNGTDLSSQSESL